MGSARWARESCTPSVVRRESPARSKAMRCLEIACSDKPFWGTISSTVDSTRSKSKFCMKSALDGCRRVPYRGSIRRVT